MPFGKGSKHTEGAKRKMRVPHVGSGIYEHKRHTEETKKKIGRNGFHFGMLGKKHSEEAKRRIGLSSKKKKSKPLYSIRGEKHWNWKGGVSLEKQQIRHSIDYEIWRSGVFARDGYTCQKYGTVGGKLVAHHVLNFSSNPDLRFAIDNGVTLSDKAHQEFHQKYGKRNNTKQQLEDFLNNS